MNQTINTRKAVVLITTNTTAYFHSYCNALIFTKEGVLTGITINWLLHKSTLKNLKILTCQELSDTEITGVNILDNPDSIQWIKPGELILTTGYIFIDNPTLQENTIWGLKKAGLILIELPLDYSLADIAKEVTQNLYQQSFHEIVKEQTLFNSLFNSYFQEKSFSETLKILSDYLDRSVFVLENYQLGQWYALSKKDTNSLKSQPPQLILLLDTIHRPLIDNYFDSLFQFLMIKNSISLFRNKSAILSVVLTGGVLRSFLLLAMILI